MKSDKEKRKSRFGSLFANNWLLGVLILLVGADICCHISYVVIENVHIILTFIGILSTFVVVSNYFQVKEAERKFEEETRELRKEFDKKVIDLKEEFGVILRNASAGLAKELYDTQVETITLSAFYMHFYIKNYDFSISNALTLIELSRNERVVMNYLPAILLLLKTEKISLRKESKELFTQRGQRITQSGKDIHELIEIIARAQINTSGDGRR